MLEKIAVEVMEDLLSIGTYLIAVSKCNCDPTFVINSAGKNMRTHSLEMSFADDPLSRSNCAAMTPYPMVNSTAREAWRAPRKEGTKLSEAIGDIQNRLKATDNVECNSSHGVVVLRTYKLWIRAWQGKNPAWRGLA